MRTSSFTEKTSQETQAATVTIQNSKGGVEQGVLARDLMTELMGVVPILGGAKVTVGFAGQDAFCDASLSYVNIPALPQAKVIPIQIAREIRGFAAHEAAHIAFTDPDIFPSKILDDKGQFDKLLKEVWNCVEDFMIERHWLELYPGARKNFAATEIRCCRGYLDRYQNDPDCAKDLRVVGPVALTWLRALYFNLGTNVSRECFETLPVSLQHRVMGWFSEMEDVETTEDCLEVARRIHADILTEPFDPANPPANPHPQAGQQGQGGQGQGQGGQGQGGQGQGQAQGQGGQGQGQGQGQAAQAGQGGSGQSGQGAATGGTQGHNPMPGNAGPDPIATSANLQQVMQDAQVVDTKNKMMSAEVASSAKSGPHSDSIGDADGYQRAEDAMKNIRGAIGATSSQLRRALKAIAKDRMKGGRLDGKLDRKRLTHAAMGSSDVYTRRIKGEEIDTAVEILVDCSHSMNGKEIAICQQLALILENAFNGTPIKHEIVGYTTGDIDEADQAFQTMIAAHQKQGTDVYGRAVNVYEFRGFNQSHFAAQCSIGNMTHLPMVGTPTGDAILMAHDRLARREERRHVMFVLTDGEPDNIPECKKAVKAVERCGVTVVGIGIGTQAVKRCFTNYVVLSNATDLPALMVSKLSKMLIGDKHKVGLRGGAAQKARNAA